ncbi:MAG: hypothetical protein R2911_22865 [Caldilineaceae bacterium]
MAIDGHSAVGKSTLAKTIANSVTSVSIVHTDDFYRVMDKDERAQLDAQGGWVSAIMIGSAWRRRCWLHWPRTNCTLSKI